MLHGTQDLPAYDMYPEEDLTFPGLWTSPCNFWSISPQQSRHQDAKQPYRVSVSWRGNVPLKKAWFDDKPTGRFSRGKQKVYPEQECLPKALTKIFTADSCLPSKTYVTEYKNNPSSVSKANGHEGLRVQSRYTPQAYSQGNSESYGMW